MYSLKVLKDLQHPDGRNFAIGHDCHALTIFEVAELVAEFPDCFEASDEQTADIVNDKEKVKHYADAVKVQKAEKGLSGDLKVRKQ